MISPTLREIEEKERELQHIEERIERAEERIEHEEKKILAAEKEILRQKRVGVRSLFGSDLSPTECYFVRSRLVRRLARHKLLFALLVTTGIVLIWRGIWHTADEVPVLSIALVSLFTGIGILWAINRYTDLH